MSTKEGKAFCLAPKLTLVIWMPKFTDNASAIKEKCYFCETEIFVNTGPGWNSTRVICRRCSKKQEGK